MKTVLTDSPLEAARFIREGEVVAFPTETVYGLGADVFCPEAVEKIFVAKGRPSDNPLIVHIAELSQLRLVTSSIPRAAELFIQTFFPGPLTLVLPRNSAVPHIVSAGLDTVGVRLPRHTMAAEFLAACGAPVAAPSANLSGRPSPTTWQAVNEDLSGRISCILKDNQTEVGLESTVVDCTGRVPLVLRAGAVTLEQLQLVAPETERAPTNSNSGEGPVRSPGLRHRHYAPNARVVLVEQAGEIVATAGAAYIGLDEPLRVDSLLFRRCYSVAEYAHELFDFFRQCDERKVEVIFCQTVEETGLGVALMDRLRRAAQR